MSIWDNIDCAWNGLIHGRKAYESVLPVPAGADVDEHLWISLTGEGGLRKNRNLPRVDHEKVINIAHYLYKSNPLGRRIVDIVPEYIIGNGIQYNSTNRDVKRALNRHWAHLTNNWSVYQFDRSRDLGLTGELCIPVFVNPGNGEVSLGNIDSGLIDHIVEDPENNMKTFAIILKKLRSENERRAYRVIDIAGMDTNDQIAGRLIGLPHNEETRQRWNVPFKVGDLVQAQQLKGTRIDPGIKARWAGSCFFVKVNSPLTANRGWTDLLQVMDWIDIHDQFLFSQAEKAKASADYVMDTTLEGADDTFISNYAKKEKQIKPGGRFYHNEKVTNTFLTPDLKLEDAGILANVLKNHILAGSGLPPIWFAESLTSRASAPEMTDPAFKHIVIRQRVVAHLISTIFRFVLDQGIIHGRILRGQRDVDTSFYVKLPDVSSKDQRMLAISIRNISGALKDATDAQFIEQSEASSLFQAALDSMGLQTWKDEPIIPDDRRIRPHNDPHDIEELLKSVTENNDNNVDTLENNDAEVTMNGSRYYMNYDSIR